MKNAKIYNKKRDEHCSDYALDQFYHYNGYSIYPSYMVSSEELKRLRREQKTDIKYHNAFKLDGFNDRAIIYKLDNNTYQLKSYDTIVAEICNGVFKKLWYGYSKTTLKHINIFREYFNFEPISKYDWIMLD